MSGLERGFDKKDEQQITNIKEGLYPTGLYFKEEDGSQGIAPRAKDGNSFNLTDEEMAKKELLTKKLIDAFPKVSEGVIDFACSFWVKYPEEFNKIISESKGQESKSVQQVEEMKKKYGSPEENNWESHLFDMEKYLLENNNNISFSQLSV